MTGKNPAWTLRKAMLADAPALRDLIRLSTEQLLAPYLSPDQIASSFRFMALDTQLIEDGTYFAVEADGQLVGSGGWSRRATTHGGDASPGRDARLLDPEREEARMRAMYTHPGYTRLGIGRAILARSEEAAFAEGFGRATLTATLGGIPLYLACGYSEMEHFMDGDVPVVRMEKALA